MASEPYETARPGDRVLVSRRRFLVGGSAALAAALVLKPNPWWAARTPGPLDALAASPGPRISVGYVLGSAGVASLAALLASGEEREVVPATSLRSGDRTLLGGLATVQVHGLSTGAGFERVDVDALVPSPAPAETGPLLPFYAWTHRGPARPPGAAPVSFSVSVEPEPRLAFALDASRQARAGRPGSGSPSEPAAAGTPPTRVFTAGGERGMAKLRPGWYLLGLEDGAWDRRRLLPATADGTWGSPASVMVSVAAST